MTKELTKQQIEAICDILAHTQNGLTKSEIKKHLSNCKISIVDDGNRNINGGFAYIIGLNKRDWLYNCFAQQINKSKSFNCVYEFIQSALNPISYTQVASRSKYVWMLEEINKVLLLLGLEVKTDGKIRPVEKATTLDEVDKRVDKLRKKLYDRSIHSEVAKYCIVDYLRKDYFDTVFEAAKGLAERVRNITGLNTDNSELFEKAFSTKDPFIYFNKLTTKSEISEHIGLKELLCAIHHLARNPAAHTPKINWIVEEDKALDILTLISFAHKYLDQCYKMPNKS